MPEAWGYLTSHTLRWEWISSEGEARHGAEAEGMVLEGEEQRGPSDSRRGQRGAPAESLAGTDLCSSDGKEGIGATGGGAPPAGGEGGGAQQARPLYLYPSLRRSDALSAPANGVGAIRGGRGLGRGLLTVQVGAPPTTRKTSQDGAQSTFTLVEYLNY